RSVTTSPLQALTLMNHSFSVDMSRYLAERVSREESSLVEQVKKVFKLAYQRDASSEELSRSSFFVKENGMDALCRAILNSNEFIFVD
ncbi:MAG: DUF1553 domain-containing protein, partial [Lentisphaeraceae bacterium]|nr:DUF1553 domain-containing protein [Lentisphaeraceae bacterium]